jgi:hypothetical protein
VDRIIVGDFTGDGKADMGAPYVSGQVKVVASTGDLSAVGRFLKRDRCDAHGDPRRFDVMWRVMCDTDVSGHL